jgi:hypothetical protein
LSGVGPGRERWTALAAAALAFAAPALRYWAPALRLNEPVYLVAGRRWLDPEYLAGDWLLSVWLPLRPFDLLAAALWSVSDNALQVALAARVLAFIAVAVGLVALARGARWPPLAVAVGFAITVLTVPSLGAGEWIVAAAEGKSFAYAAAMVALGALLAGRPLVAGLASGTALAFHPLIGGWAGLATLGALVAAPAPRRRDALRWLAGAALPALPYALLALRHLLAPASGNDAPTAEVTRLLVELRSPHHLDPAQFAAGAATAKLLACAVAATVAIAVAGRPADLRRRRLLAGYLAASVGFWLAGLAAHGLGATALLTLYPFRFADVVVPLAFWIGVVLVVTRARELPARRLAAAAAAILVAAALLAPEASRRHWRPRREWRWFVATDWSTVRAERTPANELESWIRDHTPRDSVVLVSPCLERFWLTAERGTVVSYKAAPVNRRIVEWFARLRAVGGEPTGPGGESCAAFHRHFQALSAERLVELRRRYGADLYFVLGERADLRPELLRAGAGYGLYDLDALERRLGARAASPAAAPPRL